MKEVLYCTVSPIAVHAEWCVDIVAFMLDRLIVDIMFMFTL